jgi:hypothetical protein
VGAAGVRRRVTFWSGFLFPALLAVAAFAAVQYLAALYSGPAEHSRLFDQPVRGVPERGVELQVAVHDLIEVAPEPTRIRVCRLLADRSVTVQGGTLKPLSAALDELAGQVGARVVLAVARAEDEPLPTILCPEGHAGDYLVIGRFERENK